ncbi:MAG: hypothetical protein VX278_02410, partial [Myxococcota bacterium]|nr:hypothetical protein [Myxococcota bacterium]
NGFVVGGVYWGLDEIDSEFLDLSTTDFNSNEEITIYLANATISEDLTANPVSRADVFLNSNSMSNLGVSELNAELGTYRASTNEGLQYNDNEVVTLDITHSEIEHQIGLTLPPAPIFTLPESHALGDSITIDLSGQEFYEAFVIVVRGDTGELTYERRPNDIESLYSFAHPGDDPLGENTSFIETIEIPASAFPEYNLYGIGVAGIRAAVPEDMININIMLSSLIAGKFNVQEYCVPDCQTLLELQAQQQ